MLQRTCVVGMRVVADPPKWLKAGVLEDGLLRHARPRLKRLANGCTESVKSMLFGAA